MAVESGAVPADGKASDVTCETLRQQGNDAFKRRDYAAAVDLYSRALGVASDGNDASRAALLSNRATAYYKLGGYIQAAADAEASVGIDSANHKAQYRAALSYLMQGKPAAAQSFVAALTSPGLIAPGSGSSGSDIPTATQAAALPPYLCILSRTAAAMLQHDSLKSHLKPQQEKGGRAVPAVQQAGTDTLGETAAAQRVQELLQMLSDDLDGEADADIAAVLAELAPLLRSSGLARAAFELYNGYPLVMCSFSESYCTAVAAVLQGASGWQPTCAVTLGGENCPKAASSGSGSAEGGSGPIPTATSPTSSGTASAPQQQGLPQAQSSGPQVQPELGSAAGTVLWPTQVWQRLVSTALGGGGGSGSKALATSAMQLVSWAATDPWVRTQVLTHPLPGAVDLSSNAAGPPAAGGCQSPLKAILDALLGLPKTSLCSARLVVAAVELLSRYGEDAASEEALAQLHEKPLATLVNTFYIADDLLEEEARTSTQTGSASSVANSSQLAAEQEALDQLRAKQKAVYDARLVALRRAVLRALCQLCGSGQLVAAEVPRGGGGSKGGKGAKGKGRRPEGLVADFLALVQQLHEQSPKRTCPVLGPDGRAKTFSKKPFAADFKDNPAGDFLASLDLAEATVDKPLDLFQAHTSLLQQQPAAAPQPTLLETALAALLRLAGASSNAAAQLFRLDVVGLCEALWAYSTPAVVVLAQQICCVVAERHPAALSELLQDGSVMGLAAVLQYTPLPASFQQHGHFAQPAPSSGTAGAAETSELAGTELLLRAVDKLGVLVDGCSGDEFAHLTQQPGGALVRAFQLAQQQEQQAASPPSDKAGAAAPATKSRAPIPSQGVQGQPPGKEAGRGHGGAAGDPMPGAAQQEGTQCPAEVAEAATAAATEAAAAAATLAMARTKLCRASARFVMLCCDKAQRQQGLLRQHAPRGGAWDLLGRAAVQDFVQQQLEAACRAAAASAAAAAAKAAAKAGRPAEEGKENAGDGEGGKEAAEEEAAIGEGLAKLKKGFLAGRATTQRIRQGAAKPGQQGATPSEGGASTGSLGAGNTAEPTMLGSENAPAAAGGWPAQQPASRVVIEDITDVDTTSDQTQQQQAPPAAPSAAAAAPTGQQASGAGQLSAEQEAELVKAWEQLSPAQEAELVRAWEAQQAQQAQQQAWLAYQQQQQAEQERMEQAGGSDEEDLHDVYDSTPSLEVRHIRNAWMGVELRDKLRWDQTSTDVNVWVAMPKGTRARDVKVTILPNRLTVALGWYGRVVDGPLHRRAKGSEAQWCMEDNEVHVILPKDDRSYWKALFEDGEERSYYELLKEAVDADEPTTSYDAMDDRSKELLDNMIERQAMINEGLIDPEGFDDFRVVIGDNSLVG